MIIPKFSQFIHRKINFYALMGVHAARRYSGVGGAWRLYILAKHIDDYVNGEAIGSILHSTLREFVVGSGVSPRTFNRWKKSAIECGLLSAVQTDNGEWKYILPSAGKAAYYMGADKIGKKVSLEIVDIISTGWKAKVWGAYEAGKDWQISRERLQKIANVPASTQRYRDNQAGVKRHRNYAESDIDGEFLSAVKDFTPHKGVFVNSASNKICWRIPDTRSASFADYIGKGRSRKATSELNTLRDNNHRNGALLVQRALSDDDTIERVFCNTILQARLSEASNVYMLRTSQDTSKSFSMWDVL